MSFLRRFDTPPGPPYTRPVMEPAVSDCFTTAAREVLGEMGLTVVHTEAATAQQILHEERSVVATVGLIGDLTGSFLLRLGLGTTQTVVSAMYASLGLEHRDPRELQETAIAEVANQIAGRAITLLSRRSVECDMTPPSVITGTSITSTLPGITDPAWWALEGAFGRVLIQLGLRA